MADKPIASKGPLSGVRVVELTTTLLGPIAGMYLGDLGADIIKVESPEGDPTRNIGPNRSPGASGYFMTVNRNKRVIVLDLKKPAALEALMRLIENADVFLHNLRQGAAARLNLSYAAVAKRNPKIIYASGSGYKKGTARENEPAYDDIIQGESGLATLNRTEGGEPRYIPMAIVDKVTAFSLGSAIIAALYSRTQTGRGQEVHISMLESALSFTLLEHMWGATFDPPLAAIGYPRMLTPTRRPYRTKDGYLCVLASTDAQYSRFFKAMDRSELMTDPRFANQSARHVHVVDLYTTIEGEIAKRTTAEWQARFRVADIPCGPIKEMTDLISDAYLNETGFFQKLDHPTEGKVITPSVPVEFSETPVSVRHLGPRLGSHTKEVLAELGYSEREIDAICGPSRPA